MTISVSADLAQQADAILYGRLKRSKPVFNKKAFPNVQIISTIFPDIELNACSLEIENMSFFENYKGYSGSSNWVGKCQELPKKWKSQNSKQALNNADNLISILSSIHSKDKMKPCQIKIQQSNYRFARLFCSHWDYSFLAPNTLMAALEYLNDYQGQWYFLRHEFASHPSYEQVIILATENKLAGIVRI